MKILVFGNIGSGKTTLLRRVKESLPFEVIAIDDYRRKFSNGSEEGELSARQKFFEKISLYENQFIECLGVGQVADELFNLLDQDTEPIICLTLLTPKEICHERLSARAWDIPFPKTIDNVSSLIERTERKIADNEIYNKWSKRKNTYLVSRNNIWITDIESVAKELIAEIKKENSNPGNTLKDVELMLSKNVQDYYGNEYLSYQKMAISRNSKFLEDQAMLSKFIVEANVQGNIIDIGSGNCQWFYLFEQAVDKYLAVEANDLALLRVPKSDKLLTLNKNVFDKNFKLEKEINCKIDVAFFSFFLSHFSNESIQIIFKKLADVNSLLIIDSLWSINHQEKYPKKELSEVTRKTSEKTFVTLPKRFFEYSDIDELLKPFGYSIIKFIKGNYWFACSLKKPIS